jgi:E3 ubiquitin-protein ligase BAH
MCSDEIAIFKPKLTVAIDPRDGSPIDAWLSPETRQFLRSLPRSKRGETHLHRSNSAPFNVRHQCRTSSSTNERLDALGPESGNSVQALQTVEVPLASDSEFFQLLTQELADLSQLQESERQELTTQITKLGGDISTLTEATSKRSKAEVDTWREIFRLYVESQVFFSTTEQGAGARTSFAAQQKLEEFSNGLVDERKKVKLSKNGQIAVQSFLQINASLLQFMKFQEINRTALTKIMKKFDKRTALHAQANLPMVLASEPFIAQDLARAACFIIQEQLLPIIPQLNDYLCPVCFSISFKPVRLKCNHVFCIRCLIIMQRAKQDHCPLCRGNVVMQASSGMLTLHPLWSSS